MEQYKNDIKVTGIPGRTILTIQSIKNERVHCIGSVRIWSFSGPYFPTLGLINLRIQYECGKIRTRETPNTDTFHVVITKERNIWQGRH